MDCEENLRNKLLLQLDFMGKENRADDRCAQAAFFGETIHMEG